MQMSRDGDTSGSGPEGYNGTSKGYNMEATANQLTTPLYRVSLVRERDVPNPYISDADEAARLLQDYLRDRDREYFVVLMLTAKKEVLGIHDAHVGALTSCMVVGREVFKAAVILGACSIILAHNHPSGDPEPSPEDFEVTAKMIEAGSVLGIDVLDHIIVGSRGIHSMRRRNPGVFG